MKKTGRPMKFRPAFVKRAYDLAVLGMIEREIAERFGVNESTLTRWKQKHPELCTALKLGREHGDAKVTESLYRRACGYSHPAVEFHVVDKRIVAQEFTKHYPPDTTACIFWLKNRRPDLWRDMQRLEHSGPGGKAIEIASERPTPVEIRAELEKRNAVPEGLRGWMDRLKPC